MLCQISGSVECSDSNGAGVYAMLMGCHELTQMGSQRAIIEGDLFSAIQWGQGKTQCLQRLADWVEEVHQILSNRIVLFNMCFERPMTSRKVSKGKGLHLDFSCSLSFGWICNVE